jgi:hypothetical protein
MTAMEADAAAKLETDRLSGALAAEVRGVGLNNLDDAIVANRCLACETPSA